MMGKGGGLGDAVLGELTGGFYNADTGKFAKNGKDWSNSFQQTYLTSGDPVFSSLTGATAKRLANQKTEAALDQAKVDQTNATNLTNTQNMTKDIQASRGAAGIRATSAAQANPNLRGQLLGSDERDFLGL